MRSAYNGATLFFFFFPVEARRYNRLRSRPLIAIWRIRSFVDYGPKLYECELEKCAKTRNSVRSFRSRFIVTSIHETIDCRLLFEKDIRKIPHRERNFILDVRAKPNVCARAGGREEGRERGDARKGRNASLRKEGKKLPSQPP